MSDYIKAWQCIGCGRIEAPQTCIGICQDRKVQFVYADEHEEALSELQEIRDRANALETLVRKLATTTPHADEWERSYRRFQQEARGVLAAIANAPGLQTSTLMPTT